MYALAVVMLVGGACWLNFIGCQRREALAPIGLIAPRDGGARVV